MLKVSYIIALLSSIGVFNSCTGNFINLQKDNEQLVYYEQNETVYGTYLAGRVALLRQDFDNAAKYYIKTMENGKINEDIIGRTYFILASQGKIDEAKAYADKSRELGDKNSFIDVIDAVYEFKHKNYQTARDKLNSINERTYDILIAPLFNAWSYVGENNYKEATKELNKLASAEEMKTVYNLHQGMIAEYFNHLEEAEAAYDRIINDSTADMSFRALQIISDFFVRYGKKDKAVSIISKQYGTNSMRELLSGLSTKINREENTLKNFKRTVDMGAGEVFLEVGLLYKSVPVATDYAQIYMAISEYFNPNNDVTKISMADIYESRQMYREANRYYDSIDEKSEMYYPAQLKKSDNLVLMEKYDDAATVLKKLLKDNQKNFQILFNLGNILQKNNNQEDAIKYYTEAINSIFYESERYWSIFYALGVSYDRNNEWEKAEENLEKALKLSNRHPQVLNYLGYTWLKNGVNIDRAIAYILEAYEKEPNNGGIIDSLGWVYFKTGDYKNAIIYLEKASEINPQNAIISDHLGDAYWQGGRKNEAVYLWKHALTQKEDEEELNRKKVKHKIEYGMKTMHVLTINDERIKKNLYSLNDITE